MNTPVNILVGRFQPFTLGHLKCCEQVLMSKGVPTILCAIDTIKSDERHPFLTKLLWFSFKKLIKNYKEIEDILLIKKADLVYILNELEKRGYKVVSWSAGTDRIKKYSGCYQSKDYAQGIEFIEIPRNDDDISATEVREAIKQGDEQKFKKMTPPEFHSLYPKLKKTIDEI